jgi:DNA-binding Lrp family transcriptional regulator
MGEAKLRLLEDRVLQAVAQVRTLREARDRTEDEMRELRRRLDELEREGVVLRRGLPPEESENVRSALEAAIRDLREDDDAATPREVEAPPAEREA